MYYKSIENESNKYVQKIITHAQPSENVGFSKKNNEIIKNV